jgi:PhoH-like ATPase
MNFDDMIIQDAINRKAILVTGDHLMSLKAREFGLECITADEWSDEEQDLSYSGVRDIFINTSSRDDNEKLSNIYRSRDNFLNMKENEYLAIWDLSRPTFDDNGNRTGYEAIDALKCNGEFLVPLNYEKINNNYSGKVAPVNIKQRLAFDMLQNRNTTIKAIFGGFGVGKDYLMIAHALDMLLNNKNKIEKLIWVRNNVPVKDVPEIGFLPEGMIEKLLPYAAPLADQLGGLEGLRRLLMQEKIEIQHLGFIRGRDIKNSIIYVTEVENNTKQHVKLLIGRVGEGSQLWCNGDTQQVDSDKFLYNNGVNALKQLAGEPLYGQVTLDKVERSETARLASLIN